MKVIQERGNGLAPFEFDPAELGRFYRRIHPKVIAHLAILCFADAPTFDLDPRVDARNQGKRDIWLHLNNYFKLSAEQLEEIYRGRGHVVLTEEEIING